MQARHENMKDKHKVNTHAKGLKQKTQNGQGAKAEVVIQFGYMHVATQQACQVGKNQTRRTHSTTVCETPVVDFQWYKNHERVYEITSW